MSGDRGALLSECPDLTLRLHRCDRLDGRFVLDSWRGDIVQRCLPDLAGCVLVDVLEYVVLGMPDGVLSSWEFEGFYIGS